jgi:hypothetical protein
MHFTAILIMVVALVTILSITAYGIVRAILEHKEKMAQIAAACGDASLLERIERLESKIQDLRGKDNG